ncbi:hypothetical protein A4A49_29791 [Nicotiana attenuata]|uniref:Uncharacterized protein n=1 Tax=Nicotiana attenuata TaxID=49451 RepID=A0A1J6K172_NICAT|nr:hypothetical protein A4A49_29791 [Nicotiana attenuata]
MAQQSIVAKGSRHSLYFHLNPSDRSPLSLELPKFQHCHFQLLLMHSRHKPSGFTASGVGSIVSTSTTLSVFVSDFAPNTLWARLKLL